MGICQGTTARSGCSDEAARSGDRGRHSAPQKGQRPSPTTQTEEGWVRAERPFIRRTRRGPGVPEGHTRRTDASIPGRPGPGVPAPAPPQWGAPGRFPRRLRVWGGGRGRTLLGVLFLAAGPPSPLSFLKLRRLFRKPPCGMDPTRRGRSLGAELCPGGIFCLAGRGECELGRPGSHGC